jgi:hypothetical protein
LTQGRLKAGDTEVEDDMKMREEIVAGIPPLWHSTYSPEPGAAIHCTVRYHATIARND